MQYPDWPHTGESRIAHGKNVPADTLPNPRLPVVARALQLNKKCDQGTLISTLQTHAELLPVLTPEHRYCLHMFLEDGAQSCILGLVPLELLLCS